MGDELSKATGGKDNAIDNQDGISGNAASDTMNVDDTVDFAANNGNLTWPGQDAGFLGRSSDPWLLNVNPAAANFAIPGMTLPGDVPGSAA